MVTLGVKGLKANNLRTGLPILVLFKFDYITTNLAVVFFIRGIQLCWTKPKLILLIISVYRKLTKIKVITKNTTLSTSGNSFGCISLSALVSLSLVHSLMYASKSSST